MDHKGLQRVTRRYKGLQGGSKVSEGYSGVTELFERKWNSNPNFNTQLQHQLEIQLKILTRQIGTLFPHFCCTLKWSAFRNFTSHLKKKRFLRFFSL